MWIADLIIKKRDGHELTDEEIRFFIDELVKGHVEGSQVGAMLMAWYIKGMNARELAMLTHTMTYSGDTLSWPEDWKPVLVDKHSTGGVGDKVSLILAPTLAACGLKVPMVSGRGLGFTGGTLDKLETIPGFTVDLTQEHMLSCLSDSGCCIAGQTASLVPADRILYATRDITGTVDNANFVTASIISKKAAENISALVLDVKVGRASFSRTIEEAKRLASHLVGAAKDQGIITTATLTAMDMPLGFTVGNALEVIEAVSTLRNEQAPEDLVELVLTQGALLLQSVGKAEDLAQGRSMMREALYSGSALSKFERMLINQNVRPEVAQELCHGDVYKVLPIAKHCTLLKSSQSGYVRDLDALAIAQVCGALGAARARASDIILPGVGLVLKVSFGTRINEGDTWAELHHDNEVPPALWEKLTGSIVITSEVLSTHSTRILEVIN